MKERTTAIFFLLMVNNMAFEVIIEEMKNLQNWDHGLIGITKYSKFGSENSTLWLFLMLYECKQFVVIFN